MADNAPLHVKYRPTDLDSVIGQDEIVYSLKRLLNGRRESLPHAFLFLGPSGTGKTSIARIIAREAGCLTEGLVEIDAASNTGIDAMRSVLEGAKYRALGASPTKAIIVDEAHALSKPAFQSLLLSIEEPPAHLYWLLATTEASKVPDTIRSRCHTYELRPIPTNTIAEYLEAVAADEGLVASDDVIQVCAREAFGSLRQALVNLSTVAGCEDRKEAYRLLHSVLEEGEAVDLAKFLIDGVGADKSKAWERVRLMLLQLKDENPESLRMVVIHYTQKVLLDVRDERRVPRLLAILDAFSQPFNSNDKMAPVLLAVGGLLYAAKT